MGADEHSWGGGAGCCAWGGSAGVREWGAGWRAWVGAAGWRGQKLHEPTILRWKGPPLVKSCANRRCRGAPGGLGPPSGDADLGKRCALSCVLACWALFGPAQSSVRAGFDRRTLASAHNRRMAQFLTITRARSHAPRPLRSPACRLNRWAPPRRPSFVPMLLACRAATSTLFLQNSFANKMRRFRTFRHSDWQAALSLLG